MKKILMALAALAMTMNPTYGSIVDQFQTESDPSWLVVCADWKFAQTFTPDANGLLEKIDLRLTNIFDADLFPCTVSIVNVIDGIPSGSVLGEVFTGPLVDGWNSIEFLGEAVWLEAGTHYGIVIYNDDAERYTGTSTQWAVKDGDVYSGGSVWNWMPDTGWVQSVQPPDESLPLETLYDLDATFITYIVPEPATIVLFGLAGLLLFQRISPLGNKDGTTY